jgi:hypothetical protein
MSLMSVMHTMDRIKFATTSSPIAVFRCDKVGLVNAVFANTIQTQRMIEEKDPNLIGVYHSSMDIPEINRALRKSVL